MDDREQVYDQNPYRYRLEWGRRGARRAAERGDALVVVDTVSFSTAAVTAIQHGGIIYPCSGEDDLAALADRAGAVVAVNRRDVPARGRFSLSPLTYLDMEPGTRVVLASPNGATCSRYAREVPFLAVGALVNAEAVAGVVTEVLAADERRVTLLACGERWRTPSEDGELRFAIEDWLGVGAILSYLPFTKSPEAQACEAAFVHLRDRIEELVWECGSGQELRAAGYAEDVRHAARLNVYDAVPVMRDDRLERTHRGDGALPGGMRPAAGPAAIRP